MIRATEAEQIEIENHSVNLARLALAHRERSKFAGGTGADTQSAEHLIRYWIIPMSQAVAEEQGMCFDANGNAQRAAYAPVITAARAEELAAVTLREVVSQCLRYPERGIEPSRLCKAVGQAVLDHINFEIAVEQAGIRIGQAISRAKRQRKTPKQWAKENLDDPIKSDRVAVHVGAKLLDLAMACCYDPREEQTGPAFERVVLRHSGHKKVGYVRFKGGVLSHLDHIRNMLVLLLPRKQPMVVPPKLWTPDERGGFLTRQPPDIKRRCKAHSDVDIGPTPRAALNKLNHTALTINTKVRDVLARVWDDGGGMAGLPSRDLPSLPQVPEGYDGRKPHGRRWESVSPQKKAEWFDMAGAIIRKRHKAMTERVDVINTLTSGKKYSQYEAIWNAHQFDYRGRCYPLTGYMSYQRTDYVRALFRFKGSAGYDVQSTRHMAIYASKLWNGGGTCWTAKQHIEYAKQHWKRWTQWAKHPIETIHEWEQADKPWQFLAAVTAIDHKQTLDQPIGIDGTANAFQHYAGICHDGTLSAYVNLSQCDTPRDIYSDLRTPFQAIVSRDIAHYGDYDTFECKRSLVKLACMGYLFGGHPSSSAEAITNHLQDNGLSPRNATLCGRAIATDTYREIQDRYPHTNQAKQWMCECARVLIRSTGQPVQWISPSGFPVVQPQLSSRDRTIKGSFGSMTYGDVDEAKVDTATQVKSLPANVLQCLDAAHMHRTVAGWDAPIFCIHDGYYVRPSDVGRLKVRLEKTYRSMYIQPFMNRLHRQWSRMTDKTLPTPPDPGTFDVNSPAPWRYMFD